MFSFSYFIFSLSFFFLWNVLFIAFILMLLCSCFTPRIRVCFIADACDCHFSVVLLQLYDDILQRSSFKLHHQQHPLITIANTTSMLTKKKQPCFCLIISQPYSNVNYCILDIFPITVKFIIIFILFWYLNNYSMIFWISFFTRVVSCEDQIIENCHKTPASIIRIDFINTFIRMLATVPLILNTCIFFLLLFGTVPDTLQTNDKRDTYVFLIDLLISVLWCNSEIHDMARLFFRLSNPFFSPGICDLFVSQSGFYVSHSLG